MYRKLPTIYERQTAWLEYKATCGKHGLPVLWPSPIEQGEAKEKKRYRRTKAQMQADRERKQANPTTRVQKQNRIPANTIRPSVKLPDGNPWV